MVVADGGAAEVFAVLGADAAARLHRAARGGQASTALEPQGRPPQERFFKKNTRPIVAWTVLPRCCQRRLDWSDAAGTCWRWVGGVWY